MTNVMDVKWGNKVVTGEEKAKKPGLIEFRNSLSAIEMLNKHIKNRSNIAIHCDVDMDGIGTGYITGRFIGSQVKTSITYLINKDKIHGIQQKHADYFYGKPLDLLIIVDSSSNELNIIKQFNCDVLVIDHHEVNHSELSGITDDGKHQFLIVNNTIDNLNIELINECTMTAGCESIEKVEKYTADDRMSCGLVVYELLRLYSITYGCGRVLENLKLYQWVGVTLFTDAVVLNTERNQWYIENTVHSMETEETLLVMLKALNPFKYSLDKSVINYTIAPVVNKAIRAGHSGDALNMVLYFPDRIAELNIHKEAQEEAVKMGTTDIDIMDSYIAKDMSATKIHRNYNGVIASRLCGENNRNTVVYAVNNNIAEGSFRGRIQGVDYRKYIDEYSNETSAQGHKTAFGFKCPVDELADVMSELVSVESTIDTRPLVVAGKLQDSVEGQFTIKDMDEFRRQGNIWKLGVGNSKVSTDEQILITVSSSDAILLEQKGKLYLYEILGMTCKAFSPITTSTINIYVEFSKQIDCYVK